ncbi:MAG: hypothetical protein IK002_02220 [Treponema sp.]|uniref:hypothetical protein n=1 Tax=Treponema sp. TaxID=166 RepID=UPI00298EBD9F|nr:hypothetical protein [Treponema sp.]MBR5932780.1 hypothetical protein [Treponema sp.]
MKKTFLVIFTLLMTLLHVSSQETELTLNPAYSDIEVDKDIAVIERLLSTDKKVSKKAVKEVLKNLDSYNPSVLYVLSNAYFEENKDEASKIFYIGQLRARIDANICQDISARQIVSVLNEQFGYLINQYTFQDIENLKKIVNDAIAYVRKNNVKYDRRWVNLHGMKAFNFTENDEKYTAPEEEQSEIIKNTIDKYEESFWAALECLNDK